MIMGNLSILNMRVHLFIVLKENWLPQLTIYVWTACNDTRCTALCQFVFVYKSKNDSLLYLSVSYYIFVRFTNGNDQV